MGRFPERKMIRKKVTGIIGNDNKKYNKTTDSFPIVQFFYFPHFNFIHKQVKGSLFQVPRLRGNRIDENRLGVGERLFHSYLTFFAYIDQEHGIS